MILTVAVGQIRPRKGDYQANLRAIGGVLAQVAAWEQPPQLVVFPEAVTTGYFLEGGVAERAVPAEKLYRDLAAQHALAGAPPLDIALGFYEVFQHRYYNSALYARLGGEAAGMVHVHRKIFLPTYGMFDEARFVERGHEIRSFATTWGRAALAICEDAWHGMVPALAALEGAEVLIVPSAAPARGIAPAESGPAARPGSVERWERLLRGIADEHGVFVVQAQPVGFEGGKGFPGCSTIVSPAGEVLARGPLFQEAIVAVELDWAALARARARQRLLGDLAAEWPHLVAGRQAAERSAERFLAGEGAPAVAGPPSPTAHPVVRGLPPRDPLAVDPELVVRWLVAFLQDEVVRQRGFQRVLVGLSGGVDSALVAWLAARALGPEAVTAVSLPYRTSSSTSREHAALVASQLGIRLETIEISAAVDGYLQSVGPEVSAHRAGNVMARMRMLVLFDLAAKYQALPLGTSNKTERLMGYFTWHGDDAPPVNPLGDLFKTQVLAVARQVGLPAAVVEQAPTADLVPGQTDEAELGMPYERLDRILGFLLEGLSPAEVAARGFQPEQVAAVYRRLQGTHWKRHQPAVAVLSETAIGEAYLRPLDYGL